MGNAYVKVSHDVVRVCDGETVGAVDSTWYTDGQIGTDENGFPAGGVLVSVQRFGAVPDQVLIWHYDTGYGAVDVETVKDVSSRYTLRRVVS